MKRWEYLTARLHRHSTTTDTLNELGAEGWEVCAMQPIATRPDWWEWLFKRPLPERQMPALETKAAAAREAQNVRAAIRTERAKLADARDAIENA